MKNRKAYQAVLITDPGVDDAIGILVAAAINKNATFISTYGNAETSLTTRNLNGIASFIKDNLKHDDGEFQVFQGADRQLDAEKSFVPDGGDLFFIHGKYAIEGMFESESETAASSDELVLKDGTDVFSLGATTELATLLRSQKNIINSITMMGGVLFQQGNVAPHVEANLAHDMRATADILETVKRQKIPFTLVSLDLTQHEDLILTMDRLNSILSSLRENGSENLANLVDHLCGEKSTYRNFYLQKQGIFDKNFRPRRFAGNAIHDLTAVLVKYHPELFRFEDMPLIALENGALGIPTAWMDLPQEKIRVAVDIVDPEEYWKKTTEYLSSYK